MSEPLVRYTYDTEFVDDGETIDLISIGIVCIDDGREYYAVSADFDWHKANNHPWVKTNVIPHLPLKVHCDCGHAVLDYDNTLVKSRSTIAREVRGFLVADSRDPVDREVRELWAYYGSYDHVALAQLWGPMSQLPKGIPMFTRDIKDRMIRAGNPKLPKQVNREHSAIDDAWHNRLVMRYLDTLD